MHMKGQLEVSAVPDVDPACNSNNPTLNKKNENKKIDNSGPNEFRSGRLPSRCVI